MAQILTDVIDFSKYLKETEGKQRVRSAGQYVQELIDELGVEFNEPKSLLPWEKSHKLFAFRPGEVTLWAGVNGQGKSMMTGLVALSLMCQDEKVCVASFEMKPKRSIQRMIRQWNDQPPPEAWELSDSDVLAQTKDLYEQFKDWSDERLWFYDQQGTANPQTLIGVVRYAAKELGIKHFFIDSLMKCVADEDDYNGQKKFVDELTAIARDLDIHIHLVHHIRKLENEEKLPDKTDVKGSGSITDQVDNLLLVWRNKKKENDVAAGKKVSDDEPDAMLIVSKARNGEWEGRIHLWFDKATQQYHAGPGGQALNFMRFPHRD